MGVYAHLKLQFPFLRLEQDFCFARHTTVGCGGSAAAAAYPASEKEAAKLIAFLQKEGISYCFLGAGANVLPSDKHFNGVVVRFSLLNTLRLDKTLYVGAGVTGGALLKFCLQNEVGGFEPFAGIPMTAGGAVVMNAGVKERHAGELVTSVIALQKGEITSFSPAECCFSEKYSVFQQKIAVLGVHFQAAQSDKNAIQAQIQNYLARRRRLPKGRSMGCTFVNPKEIPAGKLIEECGFKGKRVGGAVVSSEHANFILNEGATAAEIEQLIHEIKRGVYRKTGIMLREEIKRIP